MKKFELSLLLWLQNSVVRILPSLVILDHVVRPPLNQGPSAWAPNLESFYNARVPHVKPRHEQDKMAQAQIGGPNV